MTPEIQRRILQTFEQEYSDGSVPLREVHSQIAGKLWVKQLHAMLTEPSFKFSQCSAPLNQSGWGGPYFKDGRYAPGAHVPPLSATGPAWPGNPAFCDTLAQCYAHEGLGWQWAGADILAVAAEILAGGP